MLELTEVRRLLETAATGLAATRISPQQLAEVRGHLEAMRAATDGCVSRCFSCWITFSSVSSSR